METIRKKLGGMKKQLEKALGEAKLCEQELNETNAKADAVFCFITIISLKDIHLFLAHYLQTIKLLQHNLT